MVRLVSFQGDSTLLEIAIGGQSLMVRQAGEARMSEGQEVYACIDPGRIRCYPVSPPAPEPPHA